ncbi:RimJ/RimL family protein N-acetyltransferase [Novosphingobium hassiacum]|uniref:RimJ/RimL family protein N-acetyltransferase n=1 Tax=Novosphingobium hassiacum TaxID=173676 RepID=A0A7W6EUD8_9SPHN|nr:GNAT family N-acetyltransferase [Novosphingobium hassiacum]MBB3859173.1 RimJ/RimL family protein N-acetyltransferase [Novosphingobium hassiacum]
MFIRSERLFLRPGWPEDWAELHALIDDESIVCNLLREPWPYRPSDAQAFAASPQGIRHPSFLVTLPGAHGARLVGCVGLAQEEGESVLGYWVARQHWGRGFATEAVRALLTLAPTLGHKRIVARHFVDNIASARVLAKTGFRPTGEIRLGRSAARREAALTVIHALELQNSDGPQDDGIAAMRTLRAA